MAKPILPLLACLVVTAFAMQAKAVPASITAPATVAKLNGVTYGASPSTNTVPVVTGPNLTTYELVPNAALANASMTIAGHTVSLGGSQTLSATDLTNGVSGSGSIVLSNSPSLVTPSLGVAASTSLNVGAGGNQFLLDIDSLGGARISSSAGGNTLTIRMAICAQFAESSVRFTDYTTNNSGNGAEKLALGYDCYGSNSPFSFANFLESSNDPQAGTGSTNVPTDFRMIQTGDISAAGDLGRVSRVRLQMGGSGVVSFYSADNLTSGVGLPMLNIPILYNSGVSIAPFLQVNRNGVGSLLDGLFLQNATAATSGVQMWSPAVHLQGQGWSTTSTASMPLDWDLQVHTFSGAATPTSQLYLTYAINGGTAITPTFWDTNGGLNEYGNVIANAGNVGANIGFNGSTLLNAPSNGVLAIKNNSGSNSVNLTVGSGNALTLNGPLTVTSATLLASNTTLSDASASSVATLTNAPVAGNPTKWLAINDNGTIRHFPVW